MKTTLKIAILGLILAAGCAQRSDGVGTPPPACGDGTCDSGETHASCPADCTAPAACNNDGTCDPGEDNASCPADCTGDLYPPGDYAKWVCYPSRRADKWYWSCNPAYSQNAPRVEFVGSCKPLALSDYWSTGDMLPVDQDSKGAYTAQFDNTVEAICEMTYSVCPTGTNSECWAQYAQLDPSIAKYRECGTRNGVYACGIFFKTVPGQMPVPLGYYPATPPQ